MTRQLCHEDYTVGWVCALPIELAAAQEMLDEEHSDLDRRVGDNDENLYALGSIAGHNVAIVCLPAGHIGNNPAAMVATQMRTTFKAIRFGLMVGIGGGVPSATADIRLGDVVVSQPHGIFAGVVQYDAGRATSSGFERTGSLNSPPQILLAAVGRVQANEVRGRSTFSEHASKLEHIPKFQRSRAGPDILFEAAYEHDGGLTCDRCSAGRREIRPPRESENEVVLHYGTIASGNQIMRSAAERDRVSAELGGVLCFEMEAAGLMNTFPCLVIRGICDYADSHKNKRWQVHAAGMAAAYAKELLSVIPPSVVEAEKKIIDVLSGLQGVAEDHRSIAKHGLAISQQSLEIQKMAREQELSDRQKNCLQLFRLTRSTEDATYEWYKDRVEERLEGTCTWFLEHDNFQEWFKQNSGPLLVSADPGCGKSVLAKYLIDHVLPESATVCYFFFKDQDQNTVRQALCALLHQLFSQKPALIEHALKQYERDGRGVVDSTKSLWTILRDSTQDLRAGPIVIVLDALDECAESEFEDLMHNIEVQSNSSHSSNGKLRYLLTSRPYEQIVERFQRLLRVFPRIHIPGEEESETISQEVNFVINHRVKKLAEDKNLSDENRIYLADLLLKIEHRTYLWVHFVFDDLKNLGIKKTKKGIKAAVESLPKTVNQAYEKILAKSQKQPMVREALAIILAANRPLTLSELNVAMEIDDTMQSIHELELETTEDFKSRLRSWCGLFVSVYHGKVHFLHQTAREFLLANLPVPRGVQWQHSIAIQYAHRILAERCMRFLSFFESAADLFVDTTSQGSLHPSTNTFWYYSAEFWPMHFREAHFSSNKDADISYLALRLSNPDSEYYSKWSEVYWVKNGIRSRLSLQLAIVSFFGHDAVVALMLNAGANVNAQMGDKENALYVASEVGHRQVVKLLLDAGAKLDVQAGGFGYALHGAACNRDNGKEIMAILLDWYGTDVPITEEVVKVAARNPGNGKEVMTLLLDRRGEDVHITEEVVKAAAGNPGNGKEVMTLLLDRRGEDVHITEEVVKATADNAGNGKEVMMLLLNRRGEDIRITEEVVKAAAGNFYDGKEVMMLLLDRRGEDVRITEEVIKAAVRNFHNSKEVMTLLLDRRGEDVRITEEVVRAAARNFYNGKELMTLLLDRRGEDVRITEEVVKAAAGNSGNGKEVMTLLLDRRGEDVRVTEEVVKAAARNPGNGKEVMTLLLDRRGEDVRITEEVVKEAAGNFRNGKEVMTLLLDRKGEDVRITEEVVKVAAGNYGNGKEVMMLLLDQRGEDVRITEEVVKVAAGNYGNGKEVMTLLLDRRGEDVRITEEVVKAAARNFYNGKEVMTLLLDRRGEDVRITKEVVRAAARNFRNGKEVMTILLNRRGEDIHITQEVMKAAAGNPGNGKEVMTLLLDRRGEDVHITEGVAKAAAGNPGDGKEVMTLLLDRRGEYIRITEEVVKAAAGNSVNCKEVMTILLDRRGGDVRITEEVVKAAVGNSGNAKEVMMLLLDQRGEDVRITEEVVKVAAGNYGNGKEVMTLLLDRRGEDVHVTEEVVKAAARNPGNGKEVMTLLLDRRGEDVRITEEVVKEAAGNFRNGKEVMTLLLDRRGEDIRITEEVVKAAASNPGNGKEVMTLLLDRQRAEVFITEEVAEVAAGNSSGREVIEHLCKIADVTITERVIKSAATSGQEDTLIFLSKCAKIGSTLQYWLRVAYLCVAAKSGDAKAVVRLVEQGTPPDEMDVRRTTPLWHAASMGHLNVVQVLLATKAVDVDAESISHRTPIFWAAANGHVEIVKLLLAHGARNNYTDTDGQSPLGIAQLYKQVEVVDVLVGNLDKQSATQEK